MSYGPKAALVSFGVVESCKGSPDWRFEALKSFLHR